MKKIFAFVALSVLVVLILSPTAFAQTNPETGDDIVTEQTQREVRTMMIPKGANVRLLQLEKRIQRNILFGQEIINEIVAKNQSFDTRNLSSIIEEMKLLKAEVSVIAPEGNYSEMAHQFVDLKNDAIELSKEFRDIAKTQFNSTERGVLKEKIGRGIVLPERTKKIRDAIREYNGERVRNALKNMGVNKPKLVEKMRKGNGTATEVRESLKTILSEMNITKRKEAVLSMVKNISSMSVKASYVIEKTRQQFFQRKETRLQARVLNIRDKKDSILASRPRSAAARANGKINKIGKGI